MKNEDCCVAIVTHEANIGEREEISLKQALKVFSKRDIYLVVPQSLDAKYYENNYSALKIIRMDDDCFKTYQAYNNTLMSSEFYENFSNYEYVLIYQFDCFVFEDKLDYFRQLGYDWYGAAWQHENDMVGNGGFSFRKVSKMIEVCKRHKDEPKSGAEDLWFCMMVGDELNKCDLKTACNFSCENLPQRYIDLIDTVPMGLHGKNMFQYWSFEKISSVIWKEQ